MSKKLTNIFASIVIFGSSLGGLSGCVVRETRAERPRCRDAVWVGSRRNGHWECERRAAPRARRHRHDDDRPAIIIR